MKTLSVLLAAPVLLAIGAVGFAYSGLYDVSAARPHGKLTSWLLSTTAHASIERHAGAITPPDLGDQRLIHAGVNDFAAMCAGCHGAPGQEPDAMAKGLNPPAPDLAESARHMSRAELFWVTKNGIRMTGMPAWGVTHDDEALWPVVAFLKILPDLNARRYSELLAAAKDTGHHAAGDAPHDADSRQRAARDASDDTSHHDGAADCDPGTHGDPPNDDSSVRMDPDKDKPAHEHEQSH